MTASLLPPMTRTELLSRMSEMLGDIIEEDDFVLAPDTTADDVAEWDSVNHVKFILAIEQAFGVRFDTSEIGASANAGELADLVLAKMAA